MNTYSESEVKVLLKNLIEARSRIEFLEKEQKKKGADSQEKDALELKEEEIFTLKEELTAIHHSLQQAQVKIERLEREKLDLKKMFQEEKRRLEEEFESKKIETLPPEPDSERQQLIEKLAECLSLVRKQNEIIKELRRKSV